MHVPSSEKSAITATITSHGRPRTAYASLPIATSSAPVASTIVMKAPIASTNANTPTAPNNLPTPNGTTTPVSGFWSP
jgi:hypothetical protein